MSALLKSMAGVAALPFAPPVAPEPAVDPRDATIATLRHEIAELRGAAGQVAADADARIVTASERAAREARSDTRRDDAARIALLERAADAARATLEERLAQLERLAPALARTVLDRLFAASADRTALVEALLARRLGQFRREAIVAIAVSAADFDDRMIAGLAARTGVAVGHDPDLSGGQCRIDARIECLSIDLSGEWAVLAAALDAMAEGGA